MDPINKADENELQKAINNITSDAAANSVNVAIAPEGAGAEGAEEPAAIAAPAIGDTAGSDLDKVKSMALSDLRPVLEKIDIPAESKFKIYKDIIEVTNDKASIEPAYAAAKAIASEKERAEALLYIIETIDKLGLN